MEEAEQSRRMSGKTFNSSVSDSCYMYSVSSGDSNSSSRTQHKLRELFDLYWCCCCCCYSRCCYYCCFKPPCILAFLSLTIDGYKNGFSPRCDGEVRSVCSLSIMCQSLGLLQRHSWNDVWLTDWLIDWLTDWLVGRHNKSHVANSYPYFFFFCLTFLKSIKQ